MNTLESKRFKGEIERYLMHNHSLFESRIKDVFSLLSIKTWLCRTGIFKKEGYHAAHILFVLIILPVLRLKTIHSFCNKFWVQWSHSQKDTFYRFKKRSTYRWRSFLWKINLQIFKKLNLDETPRKNRYLILDDTAFRKRGKKMENVSFVRDHSLDKAVLGYCIVALTLFTDKGVYPLDFSYRFGKKRHSKSPPEKIGPQKSASGRRSYEAKHQTKLESGKSMIKQALDNGINPGYVLFDSWYAHPSFINGIRELDERVHVICRLKESKTNYVYQGKPYTLKALYKKIHPQLRKDKRMGLSYTRVTVTLPGSDDPVVIVFTLGYKEPELDDVKGKKKSKQPKWTAFLSTDTRLQASTIIQKYLKRWPIEVFFKECKQLLDLGKDQANDFQSQVTATTISFLRYSILNYLNELENYQTLGGFFEYLTDELAVISYSERLFEFFIGLFKTGIAKIFDIYRIDDDFHSYGDIIADQLTTIHAFEGCET